MDESRIPDNALTVAQTFDRAALLERLMDDESLAKEILEAFLEDIPNQIAALKDAVSKGDPSLVQRQGHSIKGASGNIGALALQEIAFRTEKAGQEKNTALASSLVPAIEEQFKKLEETLRQSGLM